MSEGTKHDTGKPSLSVIARLFPEDALIEVGKVLEFGERKYGAWNWLNGFNWLRIVDSSLRHLFAWVKGEDRDPESGLLHLAHLNCNVIFLLTFQLRGIGKDDRAAKEDGATSKKSS
jgi:hypothetical protein